jgi:hypothetical protein
MTVRDNPSTSRVARWTLLPVLAVSAMLMSLPAAWAQNFNQQATGAERDDALNWGAARGFGRAYARAPYEFSRAPYRSHRGHRRY